MNARPDAPAEALPPVGFRYEANEATLPPGIPEAPAPFRGGLAEMRQSLTNFSLDQLSSLVDDEIAVDRRDDAIAEPSTVPAAAESAPSQLSPTDEPSPTVTQIVPIAPIEAAAAALSDEAEAIPYSATVPVAASILSALLAPPAVEHPTAMTQFWDSSLIAITPPAYIPPDDESSASGVSQSLSSCNETAYYDRRSSLPETLAEVKLLQDSVTPPLAAPPQDAQTKNSADAPVAAAPRAPTINLQHPNTTDLRWAEKVDSDRQFTSLLLSELDEADAWQTTANQPARLPREAAASNAGEERAERMLSPSQALDRLREPRAVKAGPIDEPSPLDDADLAADLPEPTIEVAESERSASAFDTTSTMRDLAQAVLKKINPGVATAIAVVGCEETFAGAEGALKLAAALAEATALSTLLVDGDTRRRELSLRLDAADRTGFAEVVLRSAPWRTLVRPTPRRNLAFLSAGRGDALPHDAAAGIPAWISAAKQEYGLIVLWIGSADREAERQLCAAADGVLVIASVGRDRPSAIERTVDGLKLVNARLLGAALADGARKA